MWTAVPLTLRAQHALGPDLPAGVRRVRAKVALNVPTSDLLMVLTDDPDLPWLNQAISRAAAAPVPPAMGAE